MQDHGVVDVEEEGEAAVVIQAVHIYMTQFGHRPGRDRFVHTRGIGVKAERDPVHGNQPVKNKR